jgi:hypothetical protein
LPEGTVDEAFQRCASSVVPAVEVDSDGVTQFSEQGLNARDDTGIVLAFDRGIHPGAFELLPHEKTAARTVASFMPTFYDIDNYELVRKMGGESRLRKFAVRKNCMKISALVNRA